MKKIMTLIMASFVVSAAFANNARIVVEKVDNGGAVPGNTFRIYVELMNDTHTLHAIFGDDQNSMSIETTGEFYQHPLGGNTSLDINPMVIDLAPEVAFDTWVTVGAENSANNNLWNIGIEFDQFNAGGNLMIEDGAWFMVPTDERCTPEQGNLILIAQLTTTGQAHGLVNVQGWGADHVAWQERLMPFSTKDAQVFGCTDKAAANYNATATYNDGTCEFDNVVDSDVQVIAQSDVEATKEDMTWSVFPNPIWDGQFNIQFSDVLDGDENIAIDILDNSGKIVYSSEIAAENVIGGNRIIINKDLSAGVYNIAVRQGDITTAQQVVVQK